jgi:hypothetical protein
VSLLNGLLLIPTRVALADFFFADFFLLDFVFVLLTTLPPEACRRTPEMIPVISTSLFYSARVAVTKV